MFESLTERLTKTFKNLVGRGRLDEKNMKETLKEVKNALLDADCSLPVVQKFIQDIETSALGVDIAKSLSPAQQLVQIVNEKLIGLMGLYNESVDLSTQPPAVILMAGLQGSGKTTSAAKLALYIKTKLKKSVMVVSCDVYRPAAIDQLKTLATEVGVEFFPSTPDEAPVAIAQAALAAAKARMFEVLIVDTAGRLHIDSQMMDEIKAVHQTLSPIETLFVVDGMTGQDAANTAKAFHEALPLSGVILTKLDGDARGGAILSIRQITGKPIKFIGVGEKVDALEPFYPDRMASRILGMGDVLSLIEQLQGQVNEDEQKRLAKKLKAGKSFNLEDFRKQLIQMQNMGGMASMMDKLPGMGSIPKEAKEKVNDKSMGHMLAIINSMTIKERKKPELIKGSRKERIAKGSGRSVPEVNRLLKQFDQMQKMFKKMASKGGLQQMMRGLPKGANGLPPRGR